MGALSKPTALELLDSICPIQPAKYIERDVEILRERVEAVLELCLSQDNSPREVRGFASLVRRILDGEEAK